MGEPISFKAIGVQGHSVGHCKLNSEMLDWVGDDSHKQVKWDKIERATWSIFGQYCHVRLFYKGSGTHPLRLDGFRKADYAPIKEFLKELGIPFKREDVNCSGSHFGVFTIEGNCMTFKLGEKETFDVNIKNVSQCVLPGNNKKGNDVEIQFHESDATGLKEEDNLVEMRLFVPDGAEGQPNAEDFHQQVVEHANIGNVKGSVLVEFDQSMGTFLTPRGRYALEMYEAFFRMHGPKYDYKIQYDDISRLFLLEKSDQRYMAFVIALDKPIRQGQQRYQYLVVQASKNEGSISVNMTEEEIKERYDGALQPQMEGQVSHLLAKAFRVLTKKAVFVAGKFRSNTDQHSVGCALGPSEGNLYPLNKSFIFIHKPTKVIGFDEIAYVEFQRYSGQQEPGATRRSFDLCVTLKEGHKEFTFSGIDRGEYATLAAWCQNKHIRIKNIKEKNANAEQSALYEALEEAGEDGEIGEDSEEDDDYQAGGTSSSESDSGSDSDGSEAPKSKKKSKPSPAPKAKKAKPKPPPQADSASDGSDSDDSVQAAPVSKKEKAKAKKRKSSEGGAGTPKKKAKKKKKDPNEPKRGKSAYLFFCEAERPKLRADNPTLSMPEIAKLLGPMWKGLSADEQAPYKEKAAEAKTAADAAIKEYKAKLKADAAAEPMSESEGSASGDDSD
ncbi:unnamed protein product [Chrysoparadoxa australica]